MTDGNIVKYFMWGYQPHFCISVGCTAESIFKLLDPRLDPCVFLVGVIDQEKDGEYPVCVEPDDCRYQPDMFNGIKEQAAHLLAIDPERNTFQTHPIAQKNHHKRMVLRSIKNAVSDVIGQYDNYEGKVSFCSFPVLVNDYWVCVVLQLDREVYQSYYSLQKNKVDGRYHIATSLLDATVSKFLDECAEALRKPDPGAEMGCIDRDAKEIIRSAGKSLMYTPAWHGKDLTGLHGLFEACNVISSLKYEGSEGVGEMIVARRDHPNIEVVLQFKQPVYMRNYRAVRKILEMTGKSKDISLLTDSAYIFGLGRATGKYDSTHEDMFIIRFAKHYTWHLFHAEHEMMEVAYEQPFVPKHKIDTEKLSSDIGRIFTGIKQAETKTLLKLIEESTKQKHGTILIITTEAESEATRLAGQSILIDPIPLTAEMLKLVSSIDGALILSPSGICYATGVILDGLATEKGDPSRGARYNSAVRYVQNKTKTLAIIVSADGYVDMLPNLMPLLSRKLLNTKIADLEKMTELEFKVKDFNQLIGWFENHQFYCSAEICSKVNSLRTICDSKMKSGFKILHSDIQPNNEMNESYFVD